ncbi:MAG TPA: tetratricopeptide repeat protein [Polyangiaceae bacterium]|jgi:Flp pilus assembly protein TadD
MSRRRSEAVAGGIAAAIAGLAWLALAACGGGAVVETRPAPSMGGAAGGRPAVEDPRDLVDTPKPAAPVAATPVSSAGGDSTAAAPLPPPRPSTIKLGEGELAAGDAACEKGELDAARKHYAAAPSGVPASVGLARVRILRVDAPLDYASAKGNAEVAAAAGELARAAKAGPTFGPAFVELGRARLLLGDAPGAIDALKKGTQLLPDEPEAHSQLGVALLATGHPADAVKELARAEQLDPGSAARHGNLGTALMMAGRTKEAITEYEARARMDDGDARAHSDLGTALLATQDLDRALSELGRAVQLDPQRASTHSNLGYAQQQAGHLDRAMVEYREALRLDPKLVSAWINLATALARDPRTRKEARADLERARALSPDDPRVKANLDELDAVEKGSSLTSPNAIP